MNYILASVLANLSYAVVDNVNGLVSRKNKPLQLSVWLTLFGIVIFFVPTLLFFRSELANITVSNLTAMIGIELLVNLGYLSFITGMAKGSITTTGVIGGSFPALTTVLALVFFRENVAPTQVIAILLVLLGVGLSSMHTTISRFFRELRASGTVFALGAFVFWGLYFALIRIPVEQIGWFLPQYISNFVGLALFGTLALCSKQRSEQLRYPSLPWLIVLISVLQVSGALFFNYAILHGDTSVVAPIAGSSPAIFVLIAFFVFKERLRAVQWFGIASALSGIVLLSLAS